MLYLLHLRALDNLFPSVGSRQVETIIQTKISELLTLNSIDYHQKKNSILDLKRKSFFRPFFIIQPSNG